MKRSNNSIADHNVRIHYLRSAFRSLIFVIPVWVAYELQYISLVQLTLIEAVISGMQLLLELPTGALADLWGKRFTVVLGCATAAISILIYSQATTFEWFFVYALLYGLGNAFLSGAEESLLYDSLKQEGREHEFSKVMANGSLIFQIGLATATLIGGIIGSIYIRIPIYMWAGVVFIATCISAFAKEPKIDTEKFTLKNYILQTQMGFKELFKTPYVRDISLFYISVGSITWAAVTLFNSTLLTQIGYTAFEFGVVIAIVRIVTGVVLFRLVHLQSLLSKKRVFLLLPIFMILAYLPGIVLTKWIAAFAVGLSFLCSSTRWVVLGKYVNDEYTSRNRATALSTLSMAIAFTVMSIVIISGPLMVRFGGATFMFTVLGLLSMTIVLPLGLRIRTRYH